MKILNKLTIKHLKSNPKRTIVTIIGIILSTALMVGIGLLSSTMRDLMIKEIQMYNGSHHVSIMVPKEKLELITKNNNVEEYSYTSSLGFSTYEGITNEFKPYIQVLGSTKNYLENLKLIDGVLPLNDDEIVISEHLIYNGGLSLKVGDTITLEIGSRVSDEQILYNESFTYEFDENDEIKSLEEIVNTNKKQYKIVGICERDINENYSSASYSVFTIGEGDMNNVYITYKNPTNTYKYTNFIATSLGYDEISEDIFKKVTYNDDLLSMYGVTKYENVLLSLSLVISIVLGLVSIACVIVIYNSFAISVMERKKQFGLFSSIGTTKKQLRYTVFYEAFIVGLIGIPLGILSAYLGIGVVVYIMDKLLHLEGTSISLVTYPLFIIIPILFMILTIIISAFIPAKRASKVSPIEAIRQNDDIKIRSKKVKSPKFITKLFGIEGDIAYKNMKRNKKKYRITIISLFISIVLFISFSSLIKYGLESSVDLSGLPNYEYVINVFPKEKDVLKANEVIDNILSINDIKEYSIVNDISMVSTDFDAIYNTDNENSEFKSIYVIGLNNEYYLKYKKEIGLKEDRPIIINSYKEVEYKNNSRKTTNVKIYDKVNDFNISHYDYVLDKVSDKKYDIKNVYLTDIYPLGLNDVGPNLVTIIVSEDMLKYIYSEFGNINELSKMIYINADKYDKITEIVDNNKSLGISYYNINEEAKLITNLIIVIKILLYGFISLVTLIGVTSVLNTISTSITLRRKEFAVLRSIGLTPKGFNKMLFFESLFFGIKSLFYGIPVGLLITLALHLSLENMTEFTSFMIPYSSILICILGVFIIIMISMWYSTIKIKKENILDAIREETI